MTPRRSRESGVRSQNGLLWAGGYCALPILCVVLAALALASCSDVQRDPPIQVWPDMKFQKKFKPQLSTDLFPDTRESRRPPEGVVARGHLVEDTPFNTGMDGKLYLGKNPLKITEEVIDEGHWRFNTYCSPCHDRTGLGRGMVPTRWPAWQPANLMDDRIVQMADGDIFNVITYGRRTMPPYVEQNRPQERWAIIAYLRVLQRAAHGTLDDVPPELRSSVEYKGPPPQATPPPGTQPQQPAATTPAPAANLPQENRPQGKQTK
jgi:Cytochrome C oxidase, cbb3-type, subunit III